MSTFWFLVTFSNIFPHISSQLGDLTCDGSTWTSTYGSWSHGSGCQIQNTGSVSGSFAWIGDRNTDSLTWESYTAEMIMTPTAMTGNGGLAFHIQTPGTGANSGYYYAFALVLANPIKAMIGKFSNSYTTEAQWDMGSAHVDGNSYHLKVEVDNVPLIKVWVNSNYIGSWTDTNSPYTYGSVGARNWELPQTITDFCVNGCDTPNPTPAPTSDPSNTPTPNPSGKPTISPTTNPSTAPTLNPSTAPTLNPSHSPTNTPTSTPTMNPSYAPTKTPTLNPTLFPITSNPSTSNPTSPPNIKLQINVPTKSPYVSKLQTTDNYNAEGEKPDNNNIGSKKKGMLISIIAVGAMIISIGICLMVVSLICLYKKKRVVTVQSIEGLTAVHQATDNGVAMERINSTSPDHSNDDGDFNFDIVNDINMATAGQYPEENDDIDIDIVNEINMATAGQYPEENDDIDIDVDDIDIDVDDINNIVDEENDLDIVNDVNMTTKM